MSHSLEMSRRFTSFEEYLVFRDMNVADDALREAAERALLRDEDAFVLHGFCAVCDREDAAFAVDFAYSWEVLDGVRIPNWREHLVCQSCFLNNRMRAAFEQVRARCATHDAIYVTERITALHGALAAEFPGLIGSEYLRDGTLPGATNSSHLRHEDVTRLSFADRSLDFIASFDVLEHVPDYLAALREFSRVLRAGASALITVPFLFDQPRTKRRAIIRDDGTVEHLEPPEYHGDPLDPSGALCFNHFAWEFLDELRVAGFEDVAVTLYWSKRRGHLGRNQSLITARRP